MKSPIIMDEFMITLGRKLVDGCTWGTFIIVISAPSATTHFTHHYFLIQGVLM